ncbi:MAG: cytochrome C assembly protein [Planctomycetota bacterium]|nr:MAG: cytochrome C assembly protein [Planctomycetota bacterium]
MVIPFPGGRLIGVLMFLNLLAAHGIRFKPQAKGNRLWAGVGMIGLGVLTTWLVVASGSNADGLQSDSWISWNSLWLLFKLVLSAIWGFVVYETVQADTRESSEAASRALIPFWVKATGCTGFGLLLAWLWVYGNVLDDSSMRILWQLLKGTMAGVVLLIGCVMVFKKRAGVVLLHAGIGLMMFSELLVGLLAVEAQISLEEGEKTNFARDIRSAELAITETAEGDSETQVVVPDTRLSRGVGKEKIANELLPFDIEVIEYHKNARARPSTDETQIKATAGIGKTSALVPFETSTGVEMASKIDMPGAYVRLTKRGSGEEIGTYLVAVQLSEQDKTETIEVGDKKYDLSLRFRRDYKPYTVELKDVDGTNYLGTSMARNYSSDIRIVDESRGKDFEHHVWMNNPLRYAGETFYQSGYTQAGAKEYSTLQVVTNSGWMIPYVACMIVAVGMLFHFGVTLLRFLDRRNRETKTVTAAVVVDGAARWVPIVVVAFLALWIGSKAKPPVLKANAVDYAAVGHLPIVVDGRVKPLDTYARNMLRIISGGETFKLEYDDNGKTKTRTEPAIRWLMDVFARPAEAKRHKVVRIDNLEVLKALNLDARKGFRYSLSEIVDQPDEKDKPFRERRFVLLGQKTDEARKKGARNLTVEERKALEFERKFGLLESLMRFAESPNIDAESPLDRMQRSLGFHAALKNSKLPARFGRSRSLGLPDVGRGNGADRRSAGASVRREEHHHTARSSFEQWAVGAGRGRTIDAGSQVVGEPVSRRRKDRRERHQGVDSGRASSGQSRRGGVARNFEELRRGGNQGVQRRSCSVS